MAELEAAASAARALEFIEALPQKWDTPVDSARLSGAAFTLVNNKGLTAAWSPTGAAAACAQNSPQTIGGRRLNGRVEPYRRAEAAARHHAGGAATAEGAPIGRGHLSAGRGGGGAGARGRPGPHAPLHHPGPTKAWTLRP
eukprot:1193470-Prorocentrum_minimum.AAC.1